MSADIQTALAQEVLDLSHAGRVNSYQRNGLPGHPERNIVKESNYESIMLRLKEIGEKLAPKPEPIKQSEPVKQPDPTTRSDVFGIAESPAPIRTNTSAAATPDWIRNTVAATGIALGGLGLGYGVSTINKPDVKPVLVEQPREGNLLQHLRKVGDNLPPTGGQNGRR